MRSLPWRLHPFTLISFGILLVDQGLDLVIEFIVPAGASSMLLPGRLGIRRLPGPSPGTLDTNAFVVVLTMVLIPFLWWYKWRIQPDTFYRVAVTMLLGGLLGNLADGLRVGYPVDYLVVVIPCNLADMALILGGCMFLSRILQGPARD